MHQLQIPASVAVRRSQVRSEMSKVCPRNYVILIPGSFIYYLAASSYVDSASVLIPLSRDSQRFSSVALLSHVHSALLSPASVSTGLSRFGVARQKVRELDQYPEGKQRQECCHRNHRQHHTEEGQHFPSAFGPGERPLGEPSG